MCFRPTIWYIVGWQSRITESQCWHRQWYQWLRDRGLRLRLCWWYAFGDRRWSVGVWWGAKVGSCEAQCLLVLLDGCWTLSCNDCTDVYSADARCGVSLHDYYGTLPRAPLGEPIMAPLWCVSFFCLSVCCHLLAAERIIDCSPSGVELPAIGGYVSTVSGDLVHSTQDVPVHRIISWHLADLTFCFYTLSIVGLAVF